MGQRWVVVVMADDKSDALSIAEAIEANKDLFDSQGRPAVTRVQQEAD